MCTLKVKFAALLLVMGSIFQVSGQPFYFGADLSYVNEMEDCGVAYREGGSEKDVYRIFSDHQCNLVRLRLWHTPSWYDNLNDGRRYSDLADVKMAIARAKAEGMHVLLDFHLSDNWADPSKQVVPTAWASVVDNLPVLKDSLYNYIHLVLSQLDDENLLPEMVQIGNETNRGILLSQQVNDAGWSLDWDRNSQLFNKAIDAVRDIETATGKEIRIALHVADPEDAVWLFDQFIENGVTDFDVMGISYYWAWHQPITIAQTGAIISGLRSEHPGYEVMIFETGYIWTTASNDNANNIINSTNPAYSPASPDNQRRWLVDLTQEVINSGGSGVIYWEPAWVSSSCWTQWGHGSHQEHATFFDFDDNLLGSGGISWATYPYENLTPVKSPPHPEISVLITADSSGMEIVFGEGALTKNLMVKLVNASGQVLLDRKLGQVRQGEKMYVAFPELMSGIYFAILSDGPHRIYAQKIAIISSH